MRRAILRILGKVPFVQRELHFIYMEESKTLRRSLGKERLAELKDIHQGKRGFVIGNGPSLRGSDLERIAGEISIGSNLILEAGDYFGISWQPTYWSVIDSLVWDKVARRKDYGFPEVFISDLLDPRLAKALPVVSTALGQTRKGSLDFSNDLSDGFFLGSSVTYFNLQFAAHMGLNPIFLIGVDHMYQQPRGKTRTYRERNPNHHFLPNYRTRGEKVMRAPLREMQESFNIAAKWAEVNGVQIINLSRSSALTSFPLGEFDDVVT